jgi:hypothetical protein
MNNNLERLVNDLAIENTNYRITIMQDKYEIENLKKIIEELELKLKEGKE